jgi:hypothetical protein
VDKSVAIRHWLLSAKTAFGLTIHRIILKTKSVVKIEIPVGYEDETGFHFGTQTTEDEVQQRHN